MANERLRAKTFVEIWIDQTRINVYELGRIRETYLRKMETGQRQALAYELWRGADVTVSLNEIEYRLHPV